MNDGFGTHDRMYRSGCVFRPEVIRNYVGTSTYGTQPVASQYIPILTYPTPPMD